jgi:hypothetical protein
MIDVRLLGGKFLAAQVAAAALRGQYRGAILRP